MSDVGRRPTGASVSLTMFTQFTVALWELGVQLDPELLLHSDREAETSGGRGAGPDG